MMPRVFWQRHPYLGMVMLVITFVPCLIVYVWPDLMDGCRCGLAELRTLWGYARHTGTAE